MQRSSHPIRKLYLTVTTHEHYKYSTVTLNPKLISKSLISFSPFQRCDSVPKFYKNIKSKENDNFKLTFCSRLYSSDVTESVVDWPLQSLRLNACSSLYQQWAMLNVMKNKPLNGLNFDVSYLDTWPIAPRGVPIILTLHGVGESHRVVLPLLPYLLKDRVRVIALNFPGSGYTPMDLERHFSHTDQEKSCFVLNFLDALNISKVDLLLSHSAAIYPSMLILDRTNIVKSLVLLMPGGLEPLTKYWTSMHIYLFMTEFLRIFGMRKPLTNLEPILRLFVPGLKLNMEQVDSTVKSIVYANHETSAEVLHRISLSKFPLLLMYSSDDHHVGPHMQSVLNQMQIVPDAISRYNKENQLITPPPKPQTRPYAIVFETVRNSFDLKFTRIYTGNSNRHNRLTTRRNAALSVSNLYRNEQRLKNKVWDHLRKIMQFVT